MKLRVLSSLLLACISVSLYTAQSSAPEKQPEKQKFSPPSRTFRFTYAFAVKDIPIGTKVVKVWVPVAHTDENQIVRLVSVKAPGKTAMAQEKEYGNHIMYAEIGNGRVWPGNRSRPGCRSSTRHRPCSRATDWGVARQWKCDFSNTRMLLYRS